MIQVIVVVVSQGSVQYRDVSTSGRVVSIRAQVTTEAPAKVEKVSKKQDEGVVVNKFKPKEPYIGRCLLNTKITGDDAPGETWHMVFSTEGRFSCVFFPLFFFFFFPFFTSLCLTWIDVNRINFFELRKRILYYFRRGSLQRRTVNWGDCRWR